MRTPLGLRAGLSMLAMLASLVEGFFVEAIFVQALAQDATTATSDVARPSVEELAIPQPKPADAARESETMKTQPAEDRVRAAGKPNRRASGLRLFPRQGCSAFTARTASSPSVR